MTSLDDTEAIHPRLTKASRLTWDVPRTTLDTPATGEDRWGCSLGTLARMGGQGQPVRARKSGKSQGCHSAPAVQTEHSVHDNLWFLCSNS